ncbi:MAG TPA: hypothetical protein VFQ53_20935 [Kofleriaceae bacterium]|nr:hypothetical protein [Kofleriaceae bacterium]
MSTRRGKVVFGIGAFVFGALTFLVASSYIVSRELPLWLAAIVGALAFPMLPVTWQLIGERRRRTRLAAAKTPSKSTLTPGDRYVMRAVVVAAVALVPMFAIGRFGVIRAVWKHGTWFWPASTGSYSEAGGTTSQTPLLARVPEDAELVVVFRADDKAKDKLAVMAYGDKQLMVAAPKDASDGEPLDEKIKKLNAERDKLPFVKIDPVGLVPAPGTDLIIVASEKWAAKVAPSYGPSGAIKRELDRAPNGTVAVVAYVPKSPSAALPIKTLAGWLASKDDKLVLDARLEAIDAAAAEKLSGQARASLADNKDVPAACREPIEKIVSKIKLERSAAIVTVHAELSGEELMPLVFCALKTD